MPEAPGASSHAVIFKGRSEKINCNLKRHVAAFGVNPPPTISDLPRAFQDHERSARKSQG